MSMHDKETGWPVVTDDDKFDHQVSIHAAAYDNDDLMEGIREHLSQLNALLKANNTAAAGALVQDIRKNTIQRRAEFSHYAQVLTPVFAGEQA